MLERLKNFLLETRAEWRHLNWPTRSEAVYLTSVVIGLSIVLALMLGLMDYLFLFGLNFVINLR